MQKTLVINAVGLSGSLLGPSTPRLNAFAKAGKMASIGSVLPAVTTTVQTTYLTGVLPREHGIVANGWYFRDECEIKFWKQSSALVHRPKIWEIAKQLFLSPHTVKEHTSTLYRKLKVRNRAEAVQRAQRLGLIA